jgi:hypothetical protein
MSTALKLIAAKDAVKTANGSLATARRTIAEAHAELAHATPNRDFGLEEDLGVLSDLLDVAMNLSLKGDPRADTILLALDEALRITLTGTSWTEYVDETSACVPRKDETMFVVAVVNGGEEIRVRTPEGENHTLAVARGMKLPDQRFALKRAVARVLFPALSMRASMRALAALMGEEVRDDAV